jgi:hypothetical protein
LFSLLNAIALAPISKRTIGGIVLKKKALISLALIVALTIQLTAVNAYAAGPNLKVNGLFEAFRTKTVTVNGTVLMAMRELCSYLDAEVAWKDSNQSATLTRGETVLVMYVGDKTAYVNKAPKDMPVAAQYQNGSTALDLMVPLRFVSESLGATVGWESKTSTITLDTGKKPLQIMDVNKPTQPNAEIMTYDKALAMALQGNSSLKNLEDSVEYLKEKHDEAIESARMLGYASVDMYSSQFISILRSMRQIDDNIENVPRNKEMTEATTEYLLRSSLSQLISDELDAQLLQESIKLNEANVKNLTLKLELGMASQNDLTKAKQELEKDKVNINLMDLRVADDKTSLNKVLARSLDKEHIVDFEPEIVPLEKNLTGFIADTVTNDPSLAIKQTALDAAQYAIDNYSDTETHSPLEKQNDFNTAARDLDDTRSSLEKGLRSSINKLQQMEENNRSLEIDVENAWNTFNSLVVNYQAGLVTIYELDQAKVGILQAEAALSKNKYNHWSLSFAINHPFLLASGS